LYRLLASLLLLSTDLWACVELSGDIRPGALVWARVAPGSEVFLDDTALQVAGDGTVVLGLSRDAKGEHILRVEGTESCWQTLTVASREYNIQRIEGVPQKTVTPGPEHQKRIQREQALVNSARAESADYPYFSAGFEWPATGPISGVYGSQRVYNGTPGRPHYGVDVASPTGTAVVAPAPGIVVLAEPDLFYSGGTIIIDHGMEVFSSFLHMSKVHAVVGQMVQPGDLLGEIGATGRATGPHLDWRMKWRRHWVDPQLLVPPMP
jgi:murein DD-endopeptidase MepM/ murein hydrolase activator NlpD